MKKLTLQFINVKRIDIFEHSRVAMLKESYVVPQLPIDYDFDTLRIHKALTPARAALAELKGRALVIPNQGILIDTLSLQEAKASSEIENIVTTQDELFQVDTSSFDPASPEAKEVARYRDALKHGHDKFFKTKMLITNSTIIEMFSILKEQEGSFRKTPGTMLRHDQTNEVIYVPPQHHDKIVQLMKNLISFINDDSISKLDPLIKMAIIHHQFESIHPFTDGNGRLGRILNVLYLVRTGLLQIPILYLSRHITATKSDYYRLLQSVREDGAWEEWTCYMLEAVEQTAITTLELVEGIRIQMAQVKQRMRSDCSKIYSQDLLNNIFRHPYTRIEFVERDLDITRQTASRYLNQLVEHNFLVKQSVGNSNYYINTDLVHLLIEVTRETDT